MHQNTSSMYVYLCSVRSISLPVLSPESNCKFPHAQVSNSPNRRTRHRAQSPPTYASSRHAPETGNAIDLHMAKHIFHVSGAGKTPHRGNPTRVPAHRPLQGTEVSLCGPWSRVACARTVVPCKGVGRRFQRLIDLGREGIWDLFSLM
jgi:hypothetical protein